MRPFSKIWLFLCLLVCLVFGGACSQPPAGPANVCKILLSMSNTTACQMTVNTNPGTAEGVCDPGITVTNLLLGYYPQNYPVTVMVNNSCNGGGSENVNTGSNPTYYLTVNMGNSGTTVTFN